MVSALYTALSVAVVSPLPPKLAPSLRATLMGLAAAQAASLGLPSSVGAAAALAAISTFEAAASSLVAQPASMAAATAVAIRERHRFIITPRSVWKAATIA